MGKNWGYDRDYRKGMMGMGENWEWDGDNPMNEVKKPGGMG